MRNCACHTISTHIAVHRSGDSKISEWEVEVVAVPIQKRQVAATQG